MKVMSVKRFRSGLIAPLLFTSAGILLLLRTLLAEENYPAPSAFRSYESPSELSNSEKEYLSWVRDHIQWVIRVARLRSLRYTCVALVSALCALAVTLAVALSAPAWVPATLGFVAGAGQVFQGLVRDREQAHLGHQMAVKLQRIIRTFQAEAGELSRLALKQRFRELQRAVEETKEEYGSQILEIRGQDSSPGTSAPAG
jgi:hypothetical protein